MAKRKTASHERVSEHLGPDDDEPEHDEGAEIPEPPATGEQPGPRGARGGQNLSMPAPPAGYHEHKPAEPTEVCPAEDIPAIDYRYARPNEYHDAAPGASDPVNPPSPSTMPEHVSMVAWATPDPATAEHYPQVEEDGTTAPVGETGRKRDQQAERNRQTRQTEQTEQGAEPDPDERNANKPPE
jgi:hypothetical protein